MAVWDGGETKSSLLYLKIKKRLQGVLPFRASGPSFLLHPFPRAKLGCPTSSPYHRVQLKASGGYPLNSDTFYLSDLMAKYTWWKLWKWKECSVHVSKRLYYTCTVRFFDGGQVTFAVMKTATGSVPDPERGGEGLKGTILMFSESRAQEIWPMKAVVSFNSFLSSFWIRYRWHIWFDIWYYRLYFNVHMYSAFLLCTFIYTAWTTFVKLS